jgi:hypothetical protein
MLGHGQQKSSIPAAQVNLTGRLTARPEHFGNRVALEIILRYERCIHLARVL